MSIVNYYWACFLSFLLVGMLVSTNLKKISKNEIGANGEV